MDITPKLCCLVKPFPACCGKLCKVCWMAEITSSGKWNVLHSWEKGIEFVCPICKKVSFIEDLTP